MRTVSISQKTAGIEARERFALSNVEIDDLYSKLKEVFGINELLILSTCNRVELYYFHASPINNELARFLCTYKKQPYKEYKSHFRLLSDREAISHLFRVSVGLESQVLGDLEIYAQVKAAYQNSSDQHMSGALLNRLMHKVFYCHKLVCQNTSLKSGASSVSYSAVRLIEKELKLTSNTNILVVGAGKMGRDICGHLEKRGFDKVAITNRTDARAYELSGEHNFEFLPFDRHRAEIEAFDVVISTISTSSPLYRVADFNAVKSQTIIDVSAPRSVDHCVTAMHDLYNVDQLSERIEDVMALRAQDISKAEQEIYYSVEEFCTWQNEQIHTGQIKHFKQKLDDLRAEVMKSMCKEINPSNEKVLMELTDRLIQNIVKLPVRHIRTACRRGEAEDLTRTLISLFDIENK